MPVREVVEVESDLPDFLRADAPKTYTPKEGVCAFLHIYAEQDGKPVRVASRDIESSFAPQVAVVSKLVANGNHIQASVVPQAKVEAWLNEQAETASTSTIDLSSLAPAAEG